MPTESNVNVTTIREAIMRGLPFAELLAAMTVNKYDDLACVVMRVVATNQEIAQAIEEAIGRGEGVKL